MTAPRRASVEEWRQVSDTLSHAQHLAGQKWEQRYFDVYKCLSLAWRHHGSDSPIPWTAVTGAVRALVPLGDITAWDDTEGRSRGDVAALLGRAARSVILRAVA